MCSLAVELLLRKLRFGLGLAGFAIVFALLTLGWRLASGLHDQVCLSIVDHRRVKIEP